MDIRRSSFHVTAAAAITLMAVSFSSPTFASSEVSCAPQDSVASTSQGGVPSPLQGIRIACPLLGRIVEYFAAQDLGEAFTGEDPESSARASAMVTTFAALDDADAMKRYAKDALDAGATRLELKELIYLTAVSAGVPKAIVATQAMSELLVGQDDRCTDRSWQAELRHF
jgi:4-carboxymuconolactone decarboxylase